MTLGDYLKAAAAERGPWNCSTLAADWCVALGYPDFAAKWRGIIEPEECEAVPLRAGGLLALWDEGIGAGLPVAAEPFSAGDIAVISARGLEAGAIYTGDKWALRMPRGLAFVRIASDAVLKAWRP